MPSRRRRATISLGESTATAVKQDASNSRIVALSRSPTRCRPAAVSWMASDNRLRNFFGLVFLLLTMIVELPQFIRVQKPVDLAIAQIHIPPRQLFQIGKLSIIDVVPLTLGKAVQKNASPGCLIGHQSAIAA